MHSPRVIACLGNPGKKYTMTWHNAGFWVADILSREAGVPFVDAGLFSVATIEDGLQIIKPMAYMNRSGRAVAAFMDAEGLDPSDLLVVCDDVNLQLGRLRLRGSGSSGGHNGLQDVIDRLGTNEFPRLRMGIGPAPQSVDLADFVLGRVPSDMEEEASLMAHRAADCATLFARSGISAAQEIYNRPPEEI